MAHTSDLDANEILAGIASKIKSEHNYAYLGIRQYSALMSSRIGKDKLTFPSDGRILIFVNGLCLEILTVDTDNHLNVG